MFIHVWMSHFSFGKIKWQTFRISFKIRSLKCIMPHTKPFEGFVKGSFWWLLACAAPLEHHFCPHARTLIAHHAVFCVRFMSPDTDVSKSLQSADMNYYLWQEKTCSPTWMVMSHCSPLWYRSSRSAPSPEAGSRTAAPGWRFRRMMRNDRRLKVPFNLMQSHLGFSEYSKKRKLWWC